MTNFGQPLVTSEISRTELFSALRKKEQVGDLISGGAKSLLDLFHDDSRKGLISVMPMGSDVADTGVGLIEAGYKLQPPLLVRSLDVIHVASAILAGCNTVVGTDARQRDLARAAGLNVFP